MIEVRVSARLSAAIAQEFGPERTVGGRPSVVGVKVEPQVVELAAYAYDPGYWDLIAEDPDD